MKYIIFIFSSLISLFLFFGCAKTQEQKSLKKIDNNLTIRLEGVVLPSKKETIINSSSGYIKNIFVKNGDKVKKGDKIYELDKDLINLSIKQLKVEIANLKKLQDRLKSNQEGSVPAVNISARELQKIAYLRSKGYATQFEENIYKKNYINAIYSKNNNNNSNFEKLNTILASITNKEMQIKKLEYNLKFSSGIAPIDGFIMNLNISKNQLLSPNQAICNIFNIDKVIVKAGLASGLLAFVHKGQKVKVQFVTAPPYSINSTITQVNPIVDKKFQTMTIDIKLKNHNYILQEGTKALITIYLPQKSQQQVREIFDTKHKLIEIPSNI